MYIKKYLNNYLIYIIILFFFAIYFKFFENTYIILREAHGERLIKNYGYCERNSYGFIEHIEKKYKPKKNIHVYNDEVYPSSNSFIFKQDINFYENKIILLNNNKKNSKINLKNYSIIEKFKNCYFLKKND